MRETRRLRLKGRDFQIHEAEYGVAHLGSYSAEYVVLGEGEPLVLVPGLAGSFELLGPLANVLARHYRVISYRLRGDDSLRRFDRGFRFPDLVDDIDRFISALYLERPTVVGLSFGAALALEFAIRFPGRLSRLVVSGGPAKFIRRIPETVVQDVLSRYPLPANNGFINQFFKLLFGRNRSGNPGLLDFVTRQCWQTDQGVIAHRMGLLDEFDVEDRLGSLPVPTLVIAGQEDVVIPPRRQKPIADGVAHGRFCTIEAGGHLCFLTNPVVVARQIRRFATQTALSLS